VESKPVRWIKHLSTAHSDSAISTILEVMGPEGYGIYWLLLEQLAVTMDGSDFVPEQIHSELQWAHLLHCSTRKFRKFFETALELRLICAEIEPELQQNCAKRPYRRMRIAVPNLLKYRDEYSRKSGVSLGEVRSRADTHQRQSRVENELQEVLAEQREEVQSSPAAKALSQYEQDFEEDWPKFWRRVGKLAAFRSYCKARRTVDRDKLMDAVTAAGPLILKRAQAQGILPINPATWLQEGRWDDELDHYIPTQKTAGLSKRDQGIADFRRRLSTDVEEANE
jgi:hypothetical protein